jgi:hypothetical protein
MDTKLLMERELAGETVTLEGNLLSVPPYSPQITYILTWDRSRTAEF